LSISSRHRIAPVGEKHMPLSSRQELRTTRYDLPERTHEYLMRSSSADSPDEVASRSPPTFPHNPCLAAALAERRPGHIRDEFPEQPVGPRLKTPVRAASPKLPKSPSSRMVGNGRPGRPMIQCPEPSAASRPACGIRCWPDPRGAESPIRPQPRLRRED